MTAPPAEPQRPGEAGQVDFYVLHGGSARAAAEHFACRLTEKAWRGGNRVYLHADSSESAGRLDVLLWTFREESFVPHALTRAGEHDTPVQIGHGVDHPPADATVVINLTAQVPGFADGCARIAEIVADEPSERSAGRERYREYRDRGFTVLSHDIGGRR